MLRDMSNEGGGRGDGFMPGRPARPELEGFQDSLCAAIQQWIDAGYALIPIRPDHSKGPAVKTWAAMAKEDEPPMPAAQLIAAVRSGRCDGVAALMGRASGGTEMIELEGRAIHRLEEIGRRAEAFGIGELFDRLLGGCVESTPSGGLHCYLRVSDGPVTGNMKLACRPGEGKVEVLAETRGQGGVSICAPSGGRTHETGDSWTLVAGTPANTPTFTTAEVNELHRLFMTIDEMPTVEPRPQRNTPTEALERGDDGPLSPGDDFNRRADWADLLRGWAKVGETTDPNGGLRSFWRRPGKTQGSSASVLGDGKYFFCFSTSVDLPTEEALSKFAVYAHFHHGGDFSAAAAELSRQGYGTRASGQRHAPEEVIAYQPFPVNLLPQPLRQFVVEGARATGCDVVNIALPSLAALAAGIGNTRRLSLKPNWKVPPILWTVLVGESGTQKSTGYHLAIRPVERLQERAIAEYKTLRQQYEERLERWERERKRSQQRPSALVAEKPEAPVLPRHIVGDTTVEALAPMLQDNPRGALLARDELRGWLGSFDRYAGGSKGKADEAHWLSMYNGSSVIVDRKTAQAGPIFVPRASISITGGIQPGTLRRALGNEHRESGLAARLLMAFPPRQRKEWTEDAIRPEVLEAYAGLFDQLLTLQMTTGEGEAARPVDMVLTAEAKEVFVRYFNMHNAEALALSGDLASAWSKLEETAARLALVLELVTWAASGRSQPPEAVGAESMEMAVGLVGWFKVETRRIYASLLTDETEETPTAREQLIGFLRRRGGEATAREVRQGCRQLREAGKAEAALEDLARDGQGAWLPPEPGPGQPTRRFRLSG
jgi:hypothetical protein